MNIINYEKEVRMKLNINTLKKIMLFGLKVLYTQNVRGVKLSWFINNVHYVGKTFAVNMQL